ncbi:MAG: ATP-binding protein [Kofleriaceae bacterium]
MNRPVTTSAASQLAAWVLEDTAAMLAANDRVFGIVSMALASGAVVCWWFGAVSALTAALLWMFPTLNLALTRLGSGRHRVAMEIARTVVNAPLAIAIYVLSDGSMHDMWLPILIMDAGCALTYPVLSRSARLGYASTIWYTGLLAIGAAMNGQLGSASPLWRMLALIVVGFVLSTVVAKLADTVIEARTKRDEAETHKHNLERSLAALDERNRGMRLVLDTVAQGFITIDLDGVMASERSASVDRWFGEPAAGATFAGYLERHDPGLATWFTLGLDSVRDGFLPLELCLEQMPKRFIAGARTFEIEYAPIVRDDEMRLLLVLSDITEHVINERAEREQRELVTLFQRITSDRAGFNEFMEEAAGLIGSLARPGDPLTELRTIHTLKGNCAIYGFERCAELCHRIENELVETGGAVTDAQRAALADAWRALTAQVVRLLGEGRRNVVEIELPELARLVESARQGMAGRELAAVLASWSHEPVVRRFERLGRYAVSLARRLGKGEVALAITGDGLRLDPARWAGFWSAAVHAVRNAVDHGLDGPRARALAGKPERPTLTFAATRVLGQLTITISDDGGGVDWDLVRARARALGLPAASQADLEAAVFLDRFTTRREVSDTSGRGVGLAALRHAVEALDGTIEIASQRHQGTVLRCRFSDGDSAIPTLRMPSQPIRTYI